MKINEELRKLIPPLTKEEFFILEKSIKNEGCRDPIVIWNDVIVDGHNRFEICTKHNIPYKTIQKNFDSIEEVKIWMIDNQSGRRNLTDGWKWELTQRKKKLLLEKGKEEQKKPFKNIIKNSTGNQGVLSIIDKTPSLHMKTYNTQKELAKELGWSTGKIAIADVVWKKAPKEVKEEIKKGEKSFNQVYKEIKKKERLEKIERQREKIDKECLEKPNGLYEVIVIDPPWEYSRGGSSYDPDGNRAMVPYPEISIEELKKLKLPAEEDCVLWLWTTNAFMKEAYELLKVWGFQDKTILTWDKQILGAGWWLRNITEHCILAIKGEPRRKGIFKNEKWTTLISEKRTKHSAKPESFYKMVEEICVGKKLDYFARKKRKGWDVYGDEVQ